MDPIDVIKASVPVLAHPPSESPLVSRQASPLCHPARPVGRRSTRLTPLPPLCLCSRVEQRRRTASLIPTAARASARPSRWGSRPTWRARPRRPPSGPSSETARLTVIVIQPVEPASSTPPARAWSPGPSNLTACLSLCLSAVCRDPIPPGFLAAIHERHVGKQYVDYLPNVPNLPQVSSSRRRHAHHPAHRDCSKVFL